MSFCIIAIGFVSRTAFLVHFQYRGYCTNKLCEYVGDAMKKKRKEKKSIFLPTTSVLMIYMLISESLIKLDFFPNCKMKSQRLFLTLWLNMSVSCRRVVYWHKCCLIISTRSNSSLSSS